MVENTVDEIVGAASGKVVDKIIPNLSPFKVKSNSKVVKEARVSGVRDKKSLDKIRKQNPNRNKNKKELNESINNMTNSAANSASDAIYGSVK